MVVFTTDDDEAIASSIQRRDFIQTGGCTARLVFAVGALQQWEAELGGINEAYLVTLSL